MTKHLRREIERAEQEVKAAERRLRNLREKGDTHPIPDQEKSGRSIVDTLDGRLPVELDGYHVFEWCPTPDGSGPAQQVHLRVDFTLKASGERLPIASFLRFKHPGELDRFIAILTRHRLGVWPKEPV